MRNSSHKEVCIWFYISFSSAVVVVVVVFRIRLWGRGFVPSSGLRSVLSSSRAHLHIHSHTHNWTINSQFTLTHTHTDINRHQSGRHSHHKKTNRLWRITMAVDYHFLLYPPSIRETAKRSNIERQRKTEWNAIKNETKTVSVKNVRAVRFLSIETAMYSLMPNGVPDPKHTVHARVSTTHSQLYN